MLICILVECCTLKSCKWFEIRPSMTRISESAVFLVFKIADDQLVSINPYTSTSDIYPTLLKGMTRNSPCRYSQTLISMETSSKSSFNVNYAIIFFSCIAGKQFMFVLMTYICAECHTCGCSMKKLPLAWEIQLTCWSIPVHVFSVHKNSSCKRWWKPKKQVIRWTSITFQECHTLMPNQVTPP